MNYQNQEIIKINGVTEIRDQYIYIYKGREQEIVYDMIEKRGN